jgi:hypothetical protein
MIGPLKDCASPWAVADELSPSCRATVTNAILVANKVKPYALSPAKKLAAARISSVVATGFNFSQSGVVIRSSAERPS